jgi:hypothetical protein
LFLSYNAPMVSGLGRWRSLFARARAAWTVLREGAPGFTFVLGLGFSALVGWLLGSDLKTAVRYGGTVLQICGLLLVAYGLDRTRATFGRPTLTSRVRGWMARVLTSGRPKNVVLNSGSGEIKLSGALVLAHGRALGASIERRVEMLEQDVEQLRKQSQESTARLKRDVDALRADLAFETQKRIESDTRVEHLVSEIGVGGLHLEWIGLIWLMLATMCTALPEELASLIS